MRERRERVIMEKREKWTWQLGQSIEKKCQAFEHKREWWILRQEKNDYQACKQIGMKQFNQISLVVVYSLYFNFQTYLTKLARQDLRLSQWHLFLLEGIYWLLFWRVKWHNCRRTSFSHMIKSNHFHSILLITLMHLLCVGCPCLCVTGVITYP